jgi:transcriptional regulator with XRE-family HTH domain
MYNPFRIDLTDLRKQAGLTQRQFSERLHLPQHETCRLEKFARQGLIGAALQVLEEAKAERSGEEGLSHV